MVHFGRAALTLALLAAEIALCSCPQFVNLRLQFHRHRLGLNELFSVSQGVCLQSLAPQQQIGNDLVLSLQHLHQLLRRLTGTLGVIPHALFPETCLHGRAAIAPRILVSEHHRQRPLRNGVDGFLQQLPGSLAQIWLIRGTSNWRCGDEELLRIMCSAGNCWRPLQQQLKTLTCLTIILLCQP